MISKQSGAEPAFRLVVGLADFYFHISWKLHALLVRSDLTNRLKLFSSLQQCIIYYKRQSDQTQNL